jgi:hypothetical protein
MPTSHGNQRVLHISSSKNIRPLWAMPGTWEVLRMTPRDKPSTTASPTLTTDHSLVYWRRFWLTLASLWFTGVVIVFAGLQVKRQVLTPVRDWLPRILLLLGLR